MPFVAAGYWHTTDRMVITKSKCFPFLSIDYRLIFISNLIYINKGRKVNGRIKNKS